MSGCCLPCFGSSTAKDAAESKDSLKKEVSVKDASVTHHSHHVSLGILNLLSFWFLRSILSVWVLIKFVPFGDMIYRNKCFIFMILTHLLSELVGL